MGSSELQVLSFDWSCTGFNYLEGYWKNMASESTGHSAHSIGYMFVFIPSSANTKKKTEILFAFAHCRGQERLNFASEE